MVPPVTGRQGAAPDRWWQQTGDRRKHSAQAASPRSSRTLASSSAAVAMRPSMGASATISTGARNLRGTRDLTERVGAGLVRAGNADQVRAGILAAANLVDGCRRIGCWRVGHGLHRDWRVAAYGHAPDHDLAALAARDVAPWTDR